MTTEDLREKILADMCTLAEMYLREDNFNEDLRWLNAAADFGSRNATATLEKIHRDGTGSVQSEGKKSRRHFTKTKNNFSSCDTKFSREETYRDDRKTVDYLIETAADYPNMYIEKIYSDGQDVPMSYSERDYFFSFDTSNGDDRARFAIGCMYFYGQAVERDIYKAAWWFAKIDELYHYDNGEVFDLAECYRTGYGVKRDINVAIAWYEKIIEEDFVCLDKALFALAEIYFHGDGIERDIDTAIDFYQRAADEGNVKAAYRLAGIYLDGDGVEKDLRMVKYLLDKTIKGLPIKIET